MLEMMLEGLQVLTAQHLHIRVSRSEDKAEDKPCGEKPTHHTGACWELNWCVCGGGLSPHKAQPAEVLHLPSGPCP